MPSFVLLLAAVLALVACRHPASPPAREDATPTREAPAAGATAAEGAAPDCPAPASPVIEPCEPDPEPAPTATTGEALELVRARFGDLPGWADDRHAEAVPAFLASCEKLAALAAGARVGVSAHGGRARDWRRACAAAADLPAGDDGAARRFFESEFQPWAAHGHDGPTGRMSGYYVQALRGSRTRHGRYQTPIVARPPDLVEVQLSDFVPDGRGRRIWGRIDPDSGTLVTYPSRAELRRAGVEEKHAILWVDDPVGAVFTEIQGSGRVALDDGGVAWIGFAGKNGQRFRGVGGILRGMGELERGQGTMQGVRAWFEANPDRFHEIVDRNPSKIFFEISSRAGAIGTQDVILTPRRSMAVDRAVIALSTPIWVDTRAPTGARGRVEPFRQLLIAQDTGGAILGPVRGDIYWGDDDEAAAIAGRMGGPGRVWLLLPRGVRPAP